MPPKNLLQSEMQAAYDNGSDVMVSVKNVDYPFRGKIVDLDHAYFSLFHSGATGGMRWTLRIDDVQGWAVVIDLPALNAESSLLLSEKRLA